MPSDRVYWAALALFGLTATARGVTDLLAGSSGIATAATVLGGLLVVGGTVAAVARGDAAVDSRLARAMAVGGALLYSVVTAVELLS